MPITLNDVAKRAGVSVATVSRVINNDKLHSVNPKTAKLVLDAVVELGYAPNEYARNLRKKKRRANGNNTLGILLTSPVDSYSDPFFYDILLAVQSQAADMGYSLGFTSAFGDSSAGIWNDSQISEVAGLILLGRMSAETLQFVKQNAKHVVYAGLNHIDGQFDEVICDGFQCAKDAVEHLISLGRKKIGFIGSAVHPHSSNVVNEYRYEGYCHALESAGLPLDPSFVLDVPLSTEAVYQATRNMLQQGILPDAFFCANDYCAIGALKALHVHKVKVPQDVSIISIDNIEMSAYSNPMLSTIHVPRYELGKYATKMLVDQIQEGRNYPIRTTLPHQLIVRESCGAKPF